MVTDYYPGVPTERRDEIMILVVKEHVGYNHDVVIRRSAKNNFAVCIDLTKKRALFSSGERCNGKIKYTVEQDFIRWCDGIGIKPY